MLREVDKVKLLQVAQRAENLERAAAFYGDLLGRPPTGVFDPPGLVFFGLGEVRLLLDRAAPSALIYLEVADVRTTTAALRDKGVEVVTEAHVIFEHTGPELGPAGTDEWMAFVRDSEGNILGLASRHPHDGG